MLKKFSGTSSHKAKVFFSPQKCMKRRHVVQVIIHKEYDWIHLRLTWILKAGTVICTSKLVKILFMLLLPNYLIISAY